MKTTLDKNTFNQILVAQKNEITEYYIYQRLASKTRDEKNTDVLKRIAENEKEHYEFWKKQSGKEVKPDKLKIILYYWIARVFGLTFSVKLMEKGEEKAQTSYRILAASVDGAKQIIQDEERHENELLEMLDEKRLNYIGSIVLGLNDALVELTGALAGLSFALQNTQVVAVAGLITGIAASFSMAASEYLSNKSEGNTDSALTSSVYTGIAYIITVMLLIAPYLLMSNYLACLTVTLLIAIFIIFFFNYYIAIAKGLNFKQRFFEMLIISLGVASITFGIGFFIRKTIGVEL